jgi:hypothetical protein
LPFNRRFVFLLFFSIILLSPFLQHWQCRLLLTLFNYATVANYTWIFVEGLFLNMLIFVSVFSEKRSIVGYIVAGWGECH